MKLPRRNGGSILELRRTEENHGVSLTDVPPRLEPDTFRKCIEGYRRTDLRGVRVWN